MLAQPFLEEFASLIKRAMGQSQQIVVIVLLISSSLAAQQAAKPVVPSLDTILSGMQNARSTFRPTVSYVVIREYRLSGANNSKSDSDVIAQLNFTPPSSKDYKIQESSGSRRGQQVVRRILDHEVKATTEDDKTALNRNNYDFAYIGEVILDDRPCYLLQLKPKRNDNGLISGEVWLDKSSFATRQMEGDLVRTPSWWLRKVHIKLTFGDIQGNWLQTGMEAVADVRIAGSHTLTSRILDYRATDVVAFARSTGRLANSQTAMSEEK
jgi:hypothetical protein